MKKFLPANIQRILTKLKLCKFRQEIRRYLIRREKIRFLACELKKFERELSPKYHRGRLLNCKEMQEAKRNGTLDLFNIAKTQQKLLQGE